MSIKQKNKIQDEATLFIENNLKLNLENSILIHGGGWKKLNHENISNNIFKENKE